MYFTDFFEVDKEFEAEINTDILAWGDTFHYDNIALYFINKIWKKIPLIHRSKIEKDIFLKESGKDYILLWEAYNTYKHNSCILRHKNEPNLYLLVYEDENLWELKWVINPIFLEEFNKNYLPKVKALEYSDNRKKFNLISYEFNDIVLKEINVIKYDIDLPINYGEEFLEIDNRVINFASKDSKKSGLILLHGEPGTGKTHYIRSIISRVERKIIYVSPDMVEILAKPEFLTFMLRNKDSFIIVEDAEEIIKHKENRTPAISNLLNLTDGLLADALNLQFLCTFNCAIDDIDPALLRKGRLELKYHFKALPKESATKLLKHLNKDMEAKNEMTLSEIYNVENDNLVIKKAEKKLGFFA